MTPPTTKLVLTLYSRLRSKLTGDIWVIIFIRGPNVILINEAQTTRRHVAKVALASHYEQVSP